MSRFEATWEVLVRLDNGWLLTVSTVNEQVRLEHCDEPPVNASLFPRSAHAGAEPVKARGDD